MIGKIVGALVGRQIDRGDGDSGVKGAALGALAAGGLRRLGPLGLIVGAGYLAKKAYDRSRSGSVTSGGKGG